MAQPIQAVQIYFEHPFGAEREVLREFFSFVGCLVKTTIVILKFGILEANTDIFFVQKNLYTKSMMSKNPLSALI